MTFGGSTGESVKNDGSGYPGIRQPGVHPVKLVSVSNESYTTNNDKYMENPLQLEFYSKDGDTIYRHMHMELQPLEGDDENKTNNKVDRILYIVGKITGQDKTIQGESWKEFTDKVVNELKPYVDNKGKRPELFLKLVGNVYNGRANLQVPGYKGFLERKDSGKMPNISNKEQEKNKEYLDFNSGSPDKEESSDLPSDGEDEGIGKEGDAKDDDLPF